MAVKICPICDYPLKDNDDVVAIMVAKFKMIPSDVHFAIENPTKCIEIVHDECFDYEDYEREEIEI
jgi:hypothetical protein